MGLVGLLIVGLWAQLAGWTALVVFTETPPQIAPTVRPSSYRQRRFRSGSGAHVWGPTQSGVGWGNGHLGGLMMLMHPLKKKNEHGSQE